MSGRAVGRAGGQAVDGNAQAYLHPVLPLYQPAARPPDRPTV
jgi:hypothetical protein